MARFPQQRGIVSALAVGLAMATRASAFRIHSSSARTLSSSATLRRPANARWRLLLSATRPASGTPRTPHRSPCGHPTAWRSRTACLQRTQRLRMSATASPATDTTEASSASDAVRAEKVAAVGAEMGEGELPTNESSPELLRIRHTSAHVMAMAVQRLFPGTQVTIGPWIDNGFYYDFFSREKQMTDGDLKLIKKEMEKIIKQKLPLLREEVTREEARARIEALGEPFKLEILDSIKTEPITMYHIGDQWWDLCAGPHVETTGDLPAKAIELQTLAGAYWRGDEKREALQRIYGTAWQTPSQLKEHKRRMEEAKRRDHRVLGKKLDLFSLQEDAGGGLVFWHPKGATIRRLIEEFWKTQHLDKGYELLYTPHVANVKLWKTSGHFDFYKEGMFDQMDIEGDEYQIKPMNCPFHCLVYKDDLRSYRELPIRWAELGTVYRYERSGTLHGLMRVRGFTQDDAHIFCLPEQVEDEIISVLDLTEAILSRFGFDRYEIMLSTRPEKSVGTDEIWELATEGLKGALKRKGWDYTMDEGGGAFYGPKIDLKIRDAIGRTWQCSTVQADFNLPERFHLEYIDSDGQRKQPVMLHRAIFGSVERFFGILVENTAGTFPLWLAPEQMRLLPVTDAAREYCLQVQAKFKRAGIRVAVDRGSERLAKQIRTAEKERIPVMSVVGEKEVKEGTLAVRTRGAGDLGDIPVDQLLEKIVEANAAARELDEFLVAKTAAKSEAAIEPAGSGAAVSAS